MLMLLDGGFNLFWSVFVEILVESFVLIDGVLSEFWFLMRVLGLRDIVFLRLMIGGEFVLEVIDIFVDFL